jgi:large subunit ribosomal protein L9
MADVKSKRASKHGRFRALPRGKTGGVQVKRGYALNFLLPQGLATIATDHHKRMVEKHKARLQEIEKARLASLRQLADAIAKQSVTIEANANDEGHLYGSVNANEIAAALKQTGFHITTDQVRLEGVLKELGLYTVKIHLHAEIEAELKVWVVPTVTGDEKPTGEKGEKAGADKAAGDKGAKAEKSSEKGEKSADKPAKGAKAEKAEKK